MAAQEQPAGLPYDCSWAAPAAAISCAQVDDAIAGLGAAADSHEAASHFGPDDATWSRMLAAVRRARAELERDRLSFRERIFAQNAALRMALTVAGYAAGRESELTRNLVRESGGLVAWLALAPAQLHATAADQEIAHWLGPPAAWNEQRLAGDPVLLHESVYLSTRAFRLVRVGHRHFIFSQLVAIDSEWRPHVTAVIGDMEMRRDAPDEPSACIAEFDAAWARCGAPAGLRALDRLPISHLGGYVGVDENARANCTGCHVGGQVLGRTPYGLPAEDVAAHLAQRRARLLAALEANLAPIRAAAVARPD